MSLFGKPPAPPKPPTPATAADASQLTKPTASNAPSSLLSGSATSSGLRRKPVTQKTSLIGG